MLADHFGIPVSQIRITCGETSRHKRIEVRLPASSAKRTGV
ncbi:MAG: DUF167 domain-containing protein [Acidobacteria bacterium]|nr:DUF167 domain-containing protein [Acidobacteriota bacterium]MBU1338715.1 DUF167 domain-containing protein [Acidobacteriota bacterium]MBU1475231.1 DUF167 domain-containing protein [Acidobacteriota bacterium]MBU2438130.1 DUF167 domain-containing protein [Acidobacteriota bacterium]MBU4203517.1 DUF167 domain-containing protein [Acidobacteriota bacterium]